MAGSDSISKSMTTSLGRSSTTVSPAAGWRFSANFLPPWSILFHFYDLLVIYIAGRRANLTIKADYICGLRQTKFPFLKMLQGIRLAAEKQLQQTNAVRLHIPSTGPWAKSWIPELEDLSLWRNGCFAMSPNFIITHSILLGTEQDWPANSAFVKQSYHSLTVGSSKDKQCKNGPQPVPSWELGPSVQLFLGKLWPKQTWFIFRTVFRERCRRKGNIRNLWLT